MRYKLWWKPRWKVAIKLPLTSDVPHYWKRLPNKGTRHERPPTLCWNLIDACIFLFLARAGSPCQLSRLFCSMSQVPVWSFKPVEPTGPCKQQVCLRIHMFFVGSKVAAVPADGVGGQRWSMLWVHATCKQPTGQIQTEGDISKASRSVPKVCQDSRRNHSQKQCSHTEGFLR